MDPLPPPRMSLQYLLNNDEPRPVFSEPSQTWGKKCRYFGKLSMLPTMPMDIFFLICSYLPPRSLLALSRTNHLFRTTLLSQSSRTIWITMRKQLRVPEPGLHMSELEWASMLFDGTRCQVCGVKGVSRIDFILRRRVCYKCIRALGIRRTTFTTIYPSEAIFVLDYVLPTKGNSSARRGQGMYYTISDIDTVLAELGGKSESERKEYLDERKVHLENLTEEAKRLETWVKTELPKQRKEDAEDLRKARFESIQARLREMGYSDEVISSCSTSIHSYARTGAPLTPKAWALMRSHLTRILDREKALIDAVNLAKAQAREASESSPSPSASATIQNEEASQDALNGDATKPPPDLPTSPHVQVQDPRPTQEREGSSSDVSMMSIASQIDEFENQLSQLDVNIKVESWGFDSDVLLGTSEGSMMW
ncbi:hypothetical protein V5O48_003732 [Marasmius crinis-equi]|uniref:F-box domain-containing protein n=1 Tax=Marasmius crinis-equi TaxID=585013 RepID=A0ABR3FAF5_9AGAR